MKVILCLGIIGLAMCAHGIKDLPESTLQSPTGAEYVSGFDPTSMYMTSWWALWHKHFSEMQTVRQVLATMAASNLQTSTTTALGITSSSSATSATTLSADDDTTSVAAAATTSEDERKHLADMQDRIKELQRLQDMMNERLRKYWEFLSNTTLNHQPFPRAKNAELHSEGIINDAITADIEWDHADDEEKLVSKYWFRFSSDCTDMGKLDPTLPPVLVMQVDPLIDRYRTLLGPVHVPETARCLMIYAADMNSQPFPDPVPVPLPQFKFPKPEVQYASHCMAGLNGCFESSSNGTSCESLIGKKCCALPMCVGCRECSQVRNFEPPQPRPRLYGMQLPCVDRWERQGFAAQYGFNCAQALGWGIMSCEDDKRVGFCRKTCSYCDPKVFMKATETKPRKAPKPEVGVAIPDQ